MEENLERDQKTILVVDDEQPIIDILVYNLEKEGYNVIEANDGITAVDVALEKRPDLILLDIMLPKLDGMQATKIIRNSSHEEAKDIPIVAMTADAFDEDIKRTMQAGMNEHLTKPIDIKVLISTLISLLEK